MEHPPPSHYDELSPPSSVAGQIWDMALTDPDYASHILDSNDTAVPVSARLTRLAHLASHFNPTSKSDSMTLHHCLETLESLLDPRPALTQELARCRPMSHSRQSNSIASISTTDSQDLGNSVASLEEMSHPPLKDILREVTTLREEFDRRRKESSEIYELLTREREILARKIGELDDEIHELNTDILEDTAEREAIQGTIRGLESWVDEWHKQRLLIAAKKQSAASRRNGQRRWTKCKVEEVEGDGEALFEGITAWMRGWKDVEEVFRIREQNRTLRREERQKTRAKYV